MSRLRLAVAAIAFDLDGVLVDSMSTIRAAWADWARERRVAVDSVLGSLHLTADELVRRFAPGLDPAAEARAIANRQAALESERIVALDGAHELVAAVPPERWAVVTSGRRELATRHLALGGFSLPNVLVTAEDTPRGKPDPAGYRLAAARLGFAPAACVAIEDTPAGVRAALGAGMRVLAVTNTVSARELAEATAVVASLRAVHVTTAPNAPDFTVTVD